MAVPLRPVDALVGTPRAAAVQAYLASNALPLFVLALYAAATARFLPFELLQDGWLTLVGGREIAEHGLPSTDALTIWSHGRPWVDQQWLAQLAFFGLASAGGVKLALLAHLAVLVATMGCALAAARNLGATAPSTALVFAFTCLMAPWTLQLRAQTLALPLFVLLFWVLARDSQHADRVVYLSLPLLVLWANVHGTVLVGAGLVVLRGLFRRSPLLVVAPVVAVFASPYALELPGYYRTMLVDSMLRAYVVEWRASTPSAITAIFYASALLTVWLLGRNGRVLTRFESVALVCLLLAAIPAIRSIAWFGLAVVMLLPRLLDAERRRVETPAPAIAPYVAGAALALLTIAAAAAATRPASWFAQAWEPQAAARAAEGTRVLADERFADWLLWERPDLRGRVAFDARFELFAPDDYERLSNYHYRTGSNWRRATTGYDVLVIDVASHRDKLRELARGPWDPVYRDDNVAVLRRIAPAAEKGR